MALSNDQFKEALSYQGAELVPIHLLKRMQGNNLRYGQEHVDMLKESMQKEGLREPGWIAYDKVNRTAYLSEGNHRMNAALQAGATHFPVAAYPTSNNPGHPHPRSVPVRGTDTGPDGYLPGTMKPSDIMDF